MEGHLHHRHHDRRARTGLRHDLRPLCIHVPRRSPERVVDILETDIVANLFPLTPFPMGAYSRGPDETAACGASIVFAHTGRPGGSYPVHHKLDEAVRLVERHRATVLWGLASFVRRVIVRAQEIGADFRAVRMAMVTGEATSAAARCSCATSSATSSP